MSKYREIVILLDSQGFQKTMEVYSDQNIIRLRVQGKFNSVEATCASETRYRIFIREGSIGSVTIFVEE